MKRRGLAGNAGYNRHGRADSEREYAPKTGLLPYAEPHGVTLPQFQSNFIAPELA